MPYDWAPAASSTTAVKFVLMSRGVSENVVLINYGVVTFTMNGKSSLGESLCGFYLVGGGRYWCLFLGKGLVQAEMSEQHFCLQAFIEALFSITILRLSFDI